MTPAIIIYTDSLPEMVGGCANGPVIRIRTKYRDDIGIHEHERMHVRQWYLGVALGIAAALFLAQAPSLVRYAGWWPIALMAGTALHPLIYAMVPAYRLRSEVSAYREQLRHYPDDRAERFAVFIATRYGLGVTREAAREMLRA